MEFPPEWLILQSEDFEIAAPLDPGRCGMELMAQVRPNGLIMDHFRVVLGGAQLLEVTIDTGDLYANQAVPDMTLKWDVWPRDIAIRRNMSTSEWIDLTELIRSNDANIITNRDPAPGGSAEQVVDHNAQLLAFLDNLPERGRCGAAVRWAVGIGPSNHMELNLQGLPASAIVLNGKPTFRG